MDFREISVPGYEKVVRVEDPPSRLVAFLAVHDTTLGPSLGGMRMWPFPSEEAGLADVLRLARGMTYKSAAAGMDLGGGKSLVLGDPKRDKSEALFRAMGRAIERLRGLYITAEDVGVNEKDLEFVRAETRFVTGLSRARGSSGNPAPHTARGCLLGIRAAVAAALEGRGLRGLRFAIQGVGAVGSELARLLAAEGATLAVADLDEARARAISKETGAEIVTDREIFGIPCDVFAPCALGGVLNSRTIPALRCRIVAGAANNQLEDEARDGEALRARGVLYAPDYVLNAGGIIHVGCELLEGGYDEQEAARRLGRIPDTLAAVFALARGEGCPTNVAADRLVERRLEQARRAARR